jgi:putative ECF transporter S component (TIGR02185 family)
MLMVSKAPRHGTQLLFAFLFAVYYFITNGVILISLIILVAGVVQELLMLKGGYKSLPRLATALAVFGTGVMYAPIIMMMMSKQQLLDAAVANGVTLEYAENMFAVYSAGNIAIGTVGTVIGAVAGCLIGWRMLKKHFKPAGIVGEE